MNAVRPAARYVSGATHRYLGRQYRLKVSVRKLSDVALRGAYLHVALPEKSEAMVKNALESWYRSRALEQFERRLKTWSAWCLHRKLPAPHFRLRAMSKRWGSALRDGTIYLNPDLIRSPSVCVDYVIAHEICHLQHPDHGRKFWDLLCQLMPDWRTRKQRLERCEI
jgi:predicted metal-dependent hydrolase